MTPLTVYCWGGLVFPTAGNLKVPPNNETVSDREDWKVDRLHLLLGCHVEDSMKESHDPGSQDRGDVGQVMTVGTPHQRSHVTAGVTTVMACPVSWRPWLFSLSKPWTRGFMETPKKPTGPGVPTRCQG